MIARTRSRPAPDFLGRFEAVQRCLIVHVRHLRLRLGADRTKRLALGLIGVLVLFAAAAGVWLAVTSRQRAATLVVELQRDYDKAEAMPAGSAVDVMVDHLKVLAGKEPERVAEVVKQWVQKKNHGRTEQ